MFKLWSIKKILQLSSTVTVLAITIIAATAIYTNYVFSESQNRITEKVLPLEDASREIGSITTSFISRQNQVVVSTSLESLNKLMPTLE